MYETKNIVELERIAANLRAQIAVHPEYSLEEVQLEECERVIKLKRRELRRQLAEIRKAS